MIVSASANWKVTKRVTATAELLLSDNLDSQAVYQFLCNYEENHFCPQWLYIPFALNDSAVFSAGGGLYFEVGFFVNDLTRIKIVRPRYVGGSIFGERTLTFKYVDESMSLYNILMTNIGNPDSTSAENDIRDFVSFGPSEAEDKIDWDNIFRFYKTTKKEFPDAYLMFFDGSGPQINLSAYRKD